MDVNTKDIQLQYEGFLNTPLLWETNAILNLKQFKLPKQKTQQFKGVLAKNLRLGKRVEQFVISEIQQHNTINILIENAQIQNGKTTVGELDILIEQHKKPIHLEVIYKFYLYDASVGKTELDHWIGPNRKDSLIAKLTKLKEKQLPLLYNPFTKPLLNKLNLTAETVKQLVLFKAQLFVPFQEKKIQFKLLNSSCVKGFYIHFNELQLFTSCKFYIPSKINWLQEIQTQTKWQNFEPFYQKVEVLLKNQTAPLCWLKYPTGETQKFFIVWW
jgi:uncharacterized protein